MKTSLSIILFALFLPMLVISGTERGDEAKEPQKENLEVSMKKWEKEVREECKKKPEFKKLMDKHPLVILNSFQQFSNKGLDAFSTYCFVLKTNDRKQFIFLMPGQLRFNSPLHDPFEFDFHSLVGQQNLVVDLGKWEFEKDPDLSAISIDHPKVYSNSCKAQAGHVYLMRIRDDKGNDFYVLFQVVGLEPQGQYMAFIWRELPRVKAENK